MNRYTYDGPLYLFGRYIGNWHGETCAPSVAKAKSNLEYQYKKHSNRVAGASIHILKERIKEETQDAVRSKFEEAAGD